MTSSYEDFLAMGKNNLGDFLSVQGINISAKKVELVAKAFASVQMGIEIILSSEEQQDRLNKEYKTRLEKNKLSDPRMVTDEHSIF